MEYTKSLPKELEAEFERTNRIVFGFISWIQFCMLDTARDPEFTNNHLLSFLSQDVLETLMTVVILVKEGIHSPIIRETRYLLELSIKLAYIQQSNYSAPIKEKLEEFNKVIKSTNISPMRDINLNYLNTDSIPHFLDEVGRLYGQASNFVHVTPHSIEYRLNRMNSDRFLGLESESDLKELNDFLQKMYAASIVFITHSVPQYVIGDWHVDSSGELTTWYYIKSKYISEIDSNFDYKHERQHILDKVKSERLASIEF